MPRAPPVTGITHAPWHCELNGEITVQSLLLGFCEAVDNIQDRAFVFIGMFTAVAYLFLAENDCVFILQFVGG